MTLQVKDNKLIYISDAGRKIYADFEDSKLIRRVNQGIKHNTLVKALGLHKTKGTIIDCTAGLGVDSFIASAFGAKVVMCERDPIMQQLLEDAINRASKSSIKMVRETVSNMILIKGSSVDNLKSLAKQHAPFCIYLDPMYPHRNKSALGKADMREILTIVGEDNDSHKILQQSLTLANRVVVKRPKLAPLLTDIEPSFKVVGNSTRFDVYINS